MSEGAKAVKEDLNLVGTENMQPIWYDPLLNQMFGEIKGLVLILRGKIKVMEKIAIIIK